MALDLKELRNIAIKASEVTQNWYLDHDDTFVASEKVPKEYDWYWLTGDMSQPDNGYNPAEEDEDIRGPKEVVQAFCRHMQAFNPQTALELLDRIEELENPKEKEPAYVAKNAQALERIRRTQILNQKICEIGACIHEEHQNSDEEDDK